MPGWLAGIVVAVVLFAVAGVQADIATVKQGLSR